MEDVTGWAFSFEREFECELSTLGMSERRMQCQSPRCEAQKRAPIKRAEERQAVSRVFHRLTVVEKEQRLGYSDQLPH